MLELAIVKTTPTSKEAPVHQGKNPVNYAGAENPDNDFQDEYDLSSNDSKEIPKGAMSDAEKAKSTEENPETEDALASKAETSAVADNDDIELIVDVDSVETEDEDGTIIGSKVSTAAGKITGAEPGVGTSEVGVIDAESSRHSELRNSEKPIKDVTASGDTSQKTPKTEPQNRTTAETVFLSKAVQSHGKLDSVDGKRPVLDGEGTATLVANSKMTLQSGKPNPEATVQKNVLRFTNRGRDQVAKVEEAATKRVGLHAEVPKTQVSQAQNSIPEVQSLGVTNVLMKIDGVKDKHEVMPVTNGEIEGFGTLETRGANHSAAGSLQQLVNKADMPTLIARQMAEALQKLPDRPVEISLNPSELGRVRMSISAAEAGINVNVIAERPETLDLMRRNIDQLAREFQSLGYDSINFAFSEGETQRDFGEGQNGASDENSTQLELTSTEDVQEPPNNLSVSSGIDIRI